MNLNSNRPTSISRLIWDADLEPRNNHVIKGDLIGRIARYCGLTTDSSSGVVSATLPSIELYVGTASTSSSEVRETLTSSSTVSLVSVIDSLTSPVLSSDGANIFYPEISEGLILEIPYKVQCRYYYNSHSPYPYTVDYSAKFEFLDSNGLVLYTDNKSESGKVPGDGGICLSHTTVDMYSGTFKLPVLRGVSSLRVTFTASTWRSGYSYHRPQLVCSGANVYFSGV